MARFTLPTFIAPISIWRHSNWAGVIPPAHAADVTDFANLTPGRRVFEGVVSPTSYILIPTTCDIRLSESGSWGSWPPTDPDLVEVPTGSGLYYIVRDVERVALGFANAHLEAAIVKQSPWGGGGPPPPPPVMAFVQSDGFQQNFGTMGPFACPYTISVTLDNCLTLAITTDSMVTVTVTDSIGSTWINLSGYVSMPGLSCWTSLWRAKAVATGPCTVNVAPSMNCGFAAAIAEFSGIALVSPDDSGTSAQGTTPAITPGTTTPTAVDLQLFVGGMDAGNNASASTITAGFTLTQVPSIFTLAPGVIFGYLVGSNMALSPSAILSVTMNWAGILWCLKP